jgi:hypothetical protein
MEWEPPLSWCRVECDGSACGSGNTGWHDISREPEYIPLPPRTDDEVRELVARAYWVRSRYADGVVLAGQDEDEDGVLGVEDSAGGTVYEFSAGNAYETGVTVVLRPVTPGEMLPHHLIGVAVAATERAS